MSVLVRVRNTSSIDFTDSFDGKEYVVPGNGEIICDTEVACCWMGYPGLRNDPSKADFRRRDSYDRLRRRYGFSPGMGQTEDDWEALRPTLEVYTLTGERVYMILDDPEGRQAEALPSAAPDEVAALREHGDRMEAELEALRKIVTEKQGTSDAVEDLKEDSPQGRKVPVGSRSGRAKG